MEPKQKRDWVNIAFIVFLSLSIAANLVGLFEIQQNISANQASTIQARQDNTNRQINLKNYVKCVLLLRFDPGLIPTSTKADVSKALDECAAEE